MSEYHGWATIREAYDRPTDFDRFDEIWQKLQVRIKEEDQVNKAVSWEWNNETLHIWCNGSRNQMLGDAEETIEFFQYIAEIAPGSFGLLYIWIDRDDDDPDFPGNEFVVYVLKKGTLTKAKDPFLSPVIPTIEDEVPTGRIRAWARGDGES